MGTVAGRWRRDGVACSGTAAEERTARGICWPRRPRLRPTIAVGTGSAGRPRTVPRTRYHRSRRRVVGAGGRRQRAACAVGAADTLAADTGGEDVRPGSAAAKEATVTAGRPSARRSSTACHPARLCSLW